MIDLDTLRKAKGYVLAIVDESTGEYKPVSSDVVQVIRCKDCKEYAEWGDSMICMRLGSYHGDTKPNDFCSMAERKE